MQLKYTVMIITFQKVSSYTNNIGLYFSLGLLLRIFSYWYNMDVVEEEVLMKWREDINEDYPGKGKALFQVIQHIDVFMLCRKFELIPT